MPSVHVWTSMGATVVAAAVMGLSLGFYVTSPQGAARADSDYVDMPTGDETASETSVAMQDGPGAIHCTGCGPTLADRRWQADMAGLDADSMIDGSSSDPVVRDYEAAAMPEDLMPDTAPAAVRPLSPQVARFVAVERAPPPIAAMTSQVGMAETPPPVVATMPGEQRF
ncbi:hypothetical protein [Sphingobium sp. HWE2-09]|uniref:hypothetical protein n=1 Tax=Sphingobium sp. HWE2-09 TaxID=3108390 RepID=UPI002DC88A24|nr:hypothetical protein [Sphingobium sp. HWE2-09]